jgi:hypothetical protein
MKQGFPVVLALACCLVAAPRARAQAVPPANGQNQPAGQAPKPSASPSSANPFPEDTDSVPVIPTSLSPAVADPAAYDTSAAHLPGNDSDPVRSPDDPVSDDASGADSGSSSSLEGMDKFQPPPDTGKPDKHAKEVAPPLEGPKEDINVGGYYLQIKNWKAALSRFDSALVLDPENPEVYWGLAEAERHLGDFASAKAHYLKLLDYDPDGKHGKEARRILKEPELANAHAVSSNSSAAQPRQ